MIGASTSSSRTVVTVSFPPLGDTGEYSLEADPSGIAPGALVVVESARGKALGEVRSHPQAATEGSGGRVRKILRLATPEDLHQQEAARTREAEAFRAALKLIRAGGLDWKLVAVTADGIANTMTFCIVAPERQEVRDLARELGRSLGLRTLIRQIGPRDSAQVRGGLGRCGRELCCSTFLTDYPATSIRAAKDQNLALSPDKTNGQCGGTLCCLAYEHSDYLERGVWLPKMGKKTRTTDGMEGRVVAVNALRMTFTLLDGQRRRHVLPATEWEGNKGKDVPPPDAGPADDEACGTGRATVPRRSPSTSEASPQGVPLEQSAAPDPGSSSSGGAGDGRKRSRKRSRGRRGKEKKR